MHVHQFGIAGAAPFLVSFYGISLGTILYRLLLGKPMDEMQSSPQEDQAYAIEERFTRWLGAQR